MNKLDYLTHQLAAQQPQLMDADELCDSILDHLPPQKESKRFGLRHVLQVATSVAALLLLVLFIKQGQNIQAPREDVDYSHRLEQLQPDYSSIDPNMAPQEALREFTKVKSTRISISQLKKNPTL